MPNRTPTTRVVRTNKAGRRITYELTQAKVRALQAVTENGRVLDTVPFETARALTRQKLLRQAGPQWFITELGRDIARRVRAKQAAEGGTRG